MSSDAAKAMFPDLAKKEVSSPTRQQGKIPSTVSAAQCVYGRKEEPAPKFYNPALSSLFKPATKRK